MNVIYSNGMYRSGSTLIYNVLKKIVQDHKLDYKIKKAHEEWLQWVKDSDLSIYTYRDVRDATASMMRKRNLTVENFKSYNNHTLSSFILKLMTHDLKVKDKGNNILVLEYNNDILNLENGIKKIGEFLDIDIGKGNTFYYSKIFSLETQKKFVNGLSKHDLNTEYHPGHIGDGKTDFKKYFNYDQLNPNTLELLGKWLKKHDYEL